MGSRGEGRDRDLPSVFPQANLKMNNSMLGRDRVAKNARPRDLPPVSLHANLKIYNSTRGRDELVMETFFEFNLEQLHYTNHVKTNQVSNAKRATILQWLHPKLRTSLKA